MAQWPITGNGNPSSPRLEPAKTSASRDFLTRLDEIDGGLRLLLLSIQEPERPAWCAETSWHSEAITNSFWNHASYQFSLVANPTKKICSGRDGQLLKNSRRVPLVSREDLLDWLQRKAHQLGFTFQRNSTKTIPRPRQPFIKKGAAGLHSATEFSGVLEVVHPELFQRAALCGIGSAKVFGFGMLCLSPIKND